MRLAPPLVFLRAAQAVGRRVLAAFAAWSFALGGRVPSAAVAALIVAGCTLSPTPPGLTGVDPAWGYNGETTGIEIAGAHFFPTVIVSEANAAGGRIEGTFQAWLVDADTSVRLEGVQHLAYDMLEADVPPGIEPGVYDLRVQVPTGLVAVLPAAFTVTDTRADHLQLTLPNGVAYEVGDQAQLEIALVDPADRPVAQALEVEVVATPSGGNTVAELEFAKDLLADQTAFTTEEGWPGIRGRLGENGTGVVLVGSDAETDVKLVVEPVADGVVRGAEQAVGWDPGPIYQVVVELPEEGFETVAGVPFDVVLRLEDEYGNTLTGESADVWLLDGCDPAFEQDVQVIGEETVTVTLTAACDADTLTARYGGKRFESDAFTVHPGPLDGYDTQLFQDSVVAGDLFPLVVNAVDAYGNLVTTHANDITLSDDAGGLDLDRGVGYQLCTPFSAGASACSVRLWKAAPEVVVTVEDGDGKSGDAAPIEVVPAMPSVVSVVVGASIVEAGEDFDVSVRVLDAYGNSVSFDPAGTDPVLFTDDSGTIACRWIGALSGAQRFLCTITGAVPDANLRVRVLTLSGAAVDPLQVTNGPLAFVQVDPQGASFTVGQAYTLELQGFDAYGNPYIVQDDPRVDLAVSVGSMAPSTAMLDHSGEAVLTSVLYGSGDDVRVYAGQAGVRMGTSRPLSVADAGLYAIDVDAPAWIDVDAPGVVYLTAVDIYGNTVDGYEGLVTVDARGGSCASASTANFFGGTARVTLDCDDPALSEVLVATDEGGFGGESDLVDVVDFGCANGPLAELLLDSEDDAVLCLSEGGEVEVLADTSGSVQRGASIAARHFVDGASVEVRTLAPSTTLTYDTTGTRRVEALVVDTNACADLAEGYVYVGADDGEPTGPVEVSVSAPDPETFSTVTVDVVARDCTGDLAVYQDVVVRADLGTPSGTPSGAGLLVPLDGVGAGSFDWEFDTGYAGPATIYVGSVGGGALGTATVTVSEDAALPELVSVSPTGVELGAISTITVVFTEPMRAVNVTSSNFVLTGPTGPVTATYALSADLDTVTITPTAPLAGSAGVYTLTLTTNVRDAAGGNPLDGAWTDVPHDLVLPFGNVAEALPTVSSCDPESVVFTPDGDEGADAEADTIVVAPTATAAPEWWWLEVTAADGSRVRSARAAGASGAVEWDGRGDDGTVQPSGAYRLRIRAIDGYGNVGEACDVVVELEQHVESP